MLKAHAQVEGQRQYVKELIRWQAARGCSGPQECRADRPEEGSLGACSGVPHKALLPPAVCPGGLGQCRGPLCQAAGRSQQQQRRGRAGRPAGLPADAPICLFQSWLHKWHGTPLISSKKLWCLSQYQIQPTQSRACTDYSVALPGSAYRGLLVSAVRNTGSSVAASIEIRALCNCRQSLQRCFKSSWSSCSSSMTN